MLRMKAISDELAEKTTMIRWTVNTLAGMLGKHLMTCRETEDATVYSQPFYDVEGQSYQIEARYESELGQVYFGLYIVGFRVILLNDQMTRHVVRVVYDNLDCFRTAAYNLAYAVHEESTGEFQADLEDFS